MKSPFFLSNAILEAMNGIIYVSDPETFDVLWLNAEGKKRLGITDIRGRKCYRIFQNLDSPCPFCPINELGFDQFHTWEHYNPVVGAYFLIQDKLILWRGRSVHLEIATDISPHIEQRKLMQENLEKERILVDCLRILQEKDTCESCIDLVLGRIGRLYHADRAFVFEMERDMETGEANLVHNTHEWCAPGIVPERDTLQNISSDVVMPWLKLFRISKEVVIDDIEGIRDDFPVIYAILRRQNIRRLFAVPLEFDGGLNGFIGVDNPRTETRELFLLQTIAHSMGIKIFQYRNSSLLSELSFRDELTGLGNRNAYRSACRSMQAKPGHEVGVIFVDLNYLKYVNDNFGHEQGDRYILSLSALFASHYRGKDIFRIGGDEFVFCCDGMPKTLFYEKLRKLRNETEERFPGAVAIGAAWSAHVTDVDALVREADRAMYLEKQRLKAGRDRAKPAESFIVFIKQWLEQDPTTKDLIG